MNLDNGLNWLARIFFAIGFGALALDGAEVVVNAFGYTLLRGTYTKGRLVELAATLMVFVVTILLRQIRDGFGGRPA
jgi:uncharacterized membrane protein